MTARHEQSQWASPETLMPPKKDETLPGSPPPDGLGDYELVREIARGGMGAVYQARHKTLGRVVALKMILHGRADDEAILRFQQEARAVAALDHPGIVPLYHFGVHGGQPFFTMPFVPGGSLGSRVRETGPLSPGEAARVMRDVVAAVAHAHERGIVHRDLKPENVLLDPDGRARVTDFGLAKLRDGSETANLTAPGQIMGTPAFMAPEQVQPDTATVGPAADVYSLGGVLYYLLTGRPPFSGANLTDLLLRVVQKTPPPPRSINPTIPADLEAICLRCLEKDPARRYESAAALGEALASRRTDDGGDTANMPAEPPVRFRSRGRGMLVAALVLLACVVGAAVPAYTTGLIPRGRRAAVEPAPAAESAPVASKKKDKAAVAWLDELEKLGGSKALQVDLVGSEAGADGVHRLKEGQSIRLRITAQQAGHVGVWTVSSSGVVTQLYPSADRKEDNRLEAGQSLTVPPDDGEVVATADGGRERLLVLRTSQPFDAGRGEREGPYFVFRNRPEAKKIEQSLRGLARVPGFSCRVVPFEVN